MKDPEVKLLIVLVLLAGIVAALWFYRDLLPGDEPASTQAEPADAGEPERRGPIHPLAPIDPVDPLDGKLVPLPALDDSDSYFLLALVDTFGADLRPVLVNDALIDKFVATVDNLPRKHVPEKIRPVNKLPGAFTTGATEDKEQFLVSTSNYSRYDLLVGLISNADPAAIVASYRRFYPLMQESYERLGYPDAYFNDRVVEVIDHLLLTPAPAEPILLVQPHVLYEFADPELEALSAGQKLLLRMGSEHAAKIKSVLRNLRPLIAQP
ncbi:MAG: DUF3014 domain-containing protein [Gammaproteobacteria bacterium]|nr:DUF3014 domain-containing protein [Gammaproteobacteria bacterium]MDH5304994.1 DUF3014 domain-containing protein [Gammaproteobacteria bacterium]MDH5321994.1 DUF3014 domain-containing protein [Gammaproteobacteria bacterium]